jgi:hypothetical protein
VSRRRPPGDWIVQLSAVGPTATLDVPVTVLPPTTTSTPTTTTTTSPTATTASVPNEPGSESASTGPAAIAVIAFVAAVGVGAFVVSRRVARNRG